MTAEQFIKDYTNHSSNELADGGFHEWLTPEQALRAVEIAKDAFIEKACQWLEDNKDHPFIECEDHQLAGFLTNEFIEDFKNYMKVE